MNPIDALGDYLSMILWIIGVSKRSVGKQPMLKISLNKGKCFYRKLKGVNKYKLIYFLDALQNIGIIQRKTWLSLTK
jgi:hypothetical protein